MSKYNPPDATPSPPQTVGTPPTDRVREAIKDIHAVIENFQDLPKVNSRLPDKVILAIGKLNGAIARLEG